MSAAPQNALPARQLSAAHQLKTLYLAQLKQLLRARKTIALLVIQLIPALCALAYALASDPDGLVMFRAITERIIFPFLLPLAALFFGGPAIVDEMEGRTLTYLTLRPISKPTLYLGKLFAGMTISSFLVIGSILSLFLACLVASKDLGSTANTLLQLGAVSTVGVFTYTAVFALMGALFASSIVAGIIYFVVFEIVLAALPILELLSIRYYLRAGAGFNASDRLGALDQLVLDKPIMLDWWVGVLIATVLALMSTALGAVIFKDKQYHV